MKKFLILILISTGVLLISGCSKQNKKVERKFYNSWEKSIGYAQVTKAGNTLYLSGLTSRETSMEDQLKDIYTTITKILNDYGVDTSYILKEVAYTKDMDALKGAIQVRKEFFENEQYPAATWVQVERLFAEPILLEIEVIAWVPGE